MIPTSFWIVLSFFVGAFFGVVSMCVFIDGADRERAAVERGE